MDCYIGATTGAFKGAILKENSFQNLCEIKSLEPKRDEVTSMIWNDELQTEVLIARMNRQLNLFSVDEGEKIDLFSVEGGSGAIKGLFRYDDKYVTCVESGEVKTWNEEGEQLSEFKAGPGVSMMRGNENQVVTGGTKNLVKTWDLTTNKQTWSARNVQNDMLGLEIPIMCTDVRFIPGQNTILEATKLHEMRLYDPRAQRRPVKQMKFMENPIMSTGLTFRENYVLAANSIGEMGLFDLRSKIHPVCKFKGQAGSIRSIEGHPTVPLCASVGIDRFLRIHDLQTKKLIHKIYLKTKCNRVLLRNDLSILNNKNVAKKEINEDEEEYGRMNSNGYKEEDVSDNDDENLWDDMKTGEAGEDSNSEQESENDDEEEEDEEPATKKRKVSAAKNSRKRHDSDSDIEEIPEPKKKMKIDEKKKQRGKKRRYVDEDIKEEIIE
ncbi:unnamed protein product [Caenorhabditis angaria]|uniref:WD repeat-containing protein 74 n=1 Tax=Caenorhabditis angaria TaxID=860376 RepID=A0A9P1IYD1_9PELO|nr:unnamed protein product [Caenorhabditis angaria]